MKHLNNIVKAISLCGILLSTNTHTGHTPSSSMAHHRHSLNTAQRSSKKLASLRRHKNSVESNLSKANNDLHEMEERRPNLELERMDALQKISQLNERMNQEKRMIGQEIQRRAAVQRRLHETERRKSLAVAQAKMTYLKHYGSSTNARTQRGYNKSLKQIATLEKNIAQLRAQLTDSDSA